MKTKLESFYVLQRDGKSSFLISKIVLDNKNFEIKLLRRKHKEGEKLTKNM